jgi:hypothetical protein
LNHPGYYYPDLRSHARLALAVREAGWAFFLSPSSHVAHLETWRRPLLGGLSFPYTPAFHLPFALSGAGYDEVITLMKLAGAALSAAAIPLAGGIARRLRASPLVAVLLVGAPIYGVHLALAYLPALFGHALDLSFLCWLAWNRERIRSPAAWASAALFVAACELAYVSAVLVLPAFLLALAVASACEGAPDRMRGALGVLGFGLAGSFVALLVYYRDFVGPTLRGLVAEVETIGAANEASRGFLWTAIEMSRRNFGFPTLALATIGLVLVFRRGTQGPLAAAWLGAYGLILLGRSLLPAVFGHQHEALFVAPLVYLGVGEAVAEVAAGGLARRVAAGAILAAVVGQGLVLQWQAWVLQLANAR